MFQTMSPGRTAHAISVAIEDAVEKYDSPIMASMLAQVACPSRTNAVFQFASTGRHRHRIPMMVARKVPTTRPKRRYTQIRRLLIGFPTRSMVMQMEPLIKTRDTTYNIIQIMRYFFDSIDR
jgi:hypothetical protein